MRKSVFDDLDQLVAYLVEKKLISPVEVGTLSVEDIDPKLLKLHKSRLKSADFMDVTNK